MPATWDLLPKEILKNVFENLKDEYYVTADINLGECALVCRNWVSTAQEVRFSTIHMTLEEEFENLIYVVTLNPSLARSVKYMKYEFEIYTPNKHAAHLAIVANFFPLLEQFESEGLCENSFFELFCHLVTTGKFSHLKVFPVGYNDFQNELLKSCMLSHGTKSITEIGLRRMDELSLNDWELLCDELPHFSKLQKLDVKVFTRIPQNTVEYIESSTRSTTLKEIDLSFGCPDNATLFQLNNPLPVLNIKCFKADMTQGLGVNHADYILYLVRKFPNLETLRLRFHQWYVDPIEHNSTKRESTTASIHEVFENLTRLPNCYINFRYTNPPNLSPLFKSYFFYIPLKERSHVHLDISYSLTQAGSPLAFVEISRKKGRTLISLRLGSKLYVRLLFSFLEEFGHYFEGIKIEGDKSFNYSNVLNHISQYCVNLKSLNIYGKYSVGRTDEGQPAHKIHYSLRRVTIPGFSSEWLSLISSRFPCIETLVICHENEEIRNFNEDIDTRHTKESQSSKITYFDLQNFSLQHLILEVSVGKLYRHQFQHVYVKLITQSNGESRYIHIQAQETDDSNERPTLKFVDNPTQAGYESKTANTDYIHLEVNCKSLQKISIVERGYYAQGIAIKFDVSRNIQIPIPSFCYTAL